MLRSTNLFVLVFCLSLFTVGCGSESNTVIEDTRSTAEIEQEEADYEAMMDETSEADVSQ